MKLLSIVCALSFCFVGCKPRSFNQAEVLSEVADGKVEITGKIQTGMMAIGGETTGVILNSSEGTFELKLAEKMTESALDYDGKLVRVTGVLSTVSGIEIKKRRIIEVKKIEVVQSKYKCYELSFSESAWSRTPETLCHKELDKSNEFTLSSGTAFMNGRAVARFELNYLFGAKCLDCNMTEYGVANPSNSPLGDFKIKFEGKRNVSTKEEFGTVRIAGIKYFYKNSTVTSPVTWPEVKGNEICYQVSKSQDAWSKTPNLACKTENGESTQFEFKINEMGRKRLVSTFNYSVLSSARCIDCNVATYGVKSPSNSVFKELSLSIDGKISGKEETGTMKIGNVNFFYKNE